MNKLYDRIDFVNNTTPALNQTNLNKLSKAVDDIDDRVIEIADDVLVVVPEILDKYADIEALATNPPYIGNNGHWWTWDTDLNQYVDSGVDAGVSVTVGTTTTLPAGSNATVTNSGTDTDPILNFGIPQGVAGQDGVSPEVTIASITGGHTVTITDEDHPSGQSFNVLDGQDGSAGVGVPSGGTTGQVLKKKSGTDYDTEWQNESGGSGGHTILNSSGTSMTQRTNLQFSGMSVSDDSANDKTVVTPLTPDYVDEQFNPSTTYSKGMTCIVGNVRYRYKNSTATSGHRPPDTTYWEVLSVASELKNIESAPTLLWSKDTTTNYNSGFTLSINLSDYSKILVVGAASKNIYMSVYLDIRTLAPFVFDDGYYNFICSMFASGTYKAKFFGTVKLATQIMERIVVDLATGVSDTISFRVYGIK